MKTTGIIRRVDDLGRIVIPVEIRRVLDIDEREPLEIFVEGSSVVMKRCRTGCVFCDSGRDVADFRGKWICARCRRELQGSQAE